MLRRCVVMAGLMLFAVSCKQGGQETGAAPTAEPAKAEPAAATEPAASAPAEPAKAEPAAAAEPGAAAAPAAPSKPEIKVECDSSGCKVEEHLSAEVLAKVKQDGNLAEKKLVLYKVAFEDLAQLAQLKDDLRRLELDGMEGANLDFLKPLAALEELRIWTKSAEDPVDSAGLADKPNLKTLVFFATKVKDLSPLKGSPSLETLGVEGTAVEDLSILKDLKQLKVLILGSTQTDITPVGELTQLTEIGLNYTKLANYMPLAKCKKLEDITALDSELNTLDFIKGMPALRELKIKGSKIKKWDPLAKATKLHVLSLEGTTFSDAKLLAGMKELVNLTISRGAKVKNGATVGKLKKLQSLNIISTKGIDLKTIKALANLKSLSASKSLISDKDAEALKKGKPSLGVSTYDQ
jgi:hypothetical protein